MTPLWAEEFTVAGERAWAVEGTASYGRGLAAALARVGEWVIEFDRPREKASKDGAKSDELDAVRAVREGKTDREIRRCVKRYIARRVWRLLEHPPMPAIAT